VGESAAVDATNTIILNRLPNESKKSKIAYYNKQKTLNLLTEKSNYGYPGRKISEKNGCGIASI
jgi:hypothetical protein